MPLTDIPAALDSLQAGRFLILLDRDAPEASGHLILAADHVSADAINFVARFGRGLICVALTSDRIDRLELPPMVPNLGGGFREGPEFTVSVEARQGTTTGISAHDRAQTIRVLIDPTTRPEDLARPGHMFPIRTRPAGVLIRPRPPEAAVDLARLASLTPAAVICQMMDEEGSIAGRDQLEAFAQEYDLAIVAIDQIVEHRQRTEKLVHRVIEVRMPTKFGVFAAVAYRSVPDVAEHVALVKGDLGTVEPPLVCVHVQCLPRDVFGSPRAPADESVGPALRRLEETGRGVLLYLRRERPGLDPIFHAHEGTRSTGAAEDDVLDDRDFAIAAGILHDLSIRRILLLTDHPAKQARLERYGITVEELVPLDPAAGDRDTPDAEARRDELADLLGFDVVSGL